MPYIDKSFRGELDRSIDSLNPQIDDDGKLNYAITRILMGRKPARYADFVRLLGTLEAVKLELYRRAVATYEDIAIERNGDLLEYEEGQA